MIVVVFVRNLGHVRAMKSFRVFGRDPRKKKNAHCDAARPCFIEVLVIFFDKFLFEKWKRDSVDHHCFHVRLCSHRRHKHPTVDVL